MAGLNAAMAVRTGKQMTDGGWKVALYLDDRASQEQSEALGAIFSGAAGGHLAALGPLIGEVAGVAPASITFTKDGANVSATVGDTLSMSAEQLVGMDRNQSRGHREPTDGGCAQPVRQGRAGDVTYHGHWDTEYSGTNSFLTDFKYEG